jgi:hypothetical protein
MPDRALSFEHDIQPLFRQSDRSAMRRAFDLWSATDVATHGDAIAARLADGTMPGDGAWPEEQVATFRGWLAVGAVP